MKALRAVWRVLRVVARLLAGLATITFEFPRLDARQREQRVQAWAASMLDVLGIGLRVHGQPPQAGPLLMVANHISWLDILVLHASRHCRFVSKADVRRWPLIGTMATAAGTLYIERESRRDAMRVVHRMAQALQSGDILAVFPEGTTTDGTDLLAFHANLIQAAVAAGAPVLPVGVQYLDTATGQPSRAPCYIDDDTLVVSVWRTLSGDAFNAVVRFGTPQDANGRDRRAWAADLRNDVRALRSPG
jgi:1-acyl-sn-glycerol-3-phosphate acyltransferase